MIAVTALHGLQDGARFSFHLLNALIDTYDHPFGRMKVQE